MPTLPPHPIVYEINTWVWLHELGRQHGARLTLATVPDSVWDDLAALGADAIWLMGVWERSPAGIAIAREEAPLMESLRAALPDMADADLVGSPYSIRRYEADAALGGSAALAAARAALAARGMGLILDFVPNHVAPDHPWTTAHPAYFIGGDNADIERAPAEFLRIGHNVIARGRDPYFEPWGDVVQLNAFDSGQRAAAIATLHQIAEQCDGVRCDMAMLLLNDIFAQTWGERAGPPPPSEYWSEVIGSVRRAHPGFTWIAEAYWDMEWALQQRGFDYCYDKRLYDRLAHDSPATVAGHLRAEPAYQRRLVRFIENHDEPRAAASFGPAQHRAVAVTAYTQPGMRLLHEGQLDGRTVRVPVQLGRRPDEPPSPQIRHFYSRLLAAMKLAPLRQGAWRLCELTGWPDNESFRSLVAWAWVAKNGWSVVAVNLSDAPAQARVHLSWVGLAGRRWYLRDQLDDARYERDGDTLTSEGLFVDLPPWGAHILVTE